MRRGSNVVVKLMILSLCSISVTGRFFTDLFFPNEARSSHPKIIGNLTRIFRENFLKFDPENKVYTPEDFTPEIRTKIAQTWLRKKGKIISIDKRFQQLPTLISEIDAKSKRLKVSHTDEASKKQLRKLQKASESLRIIIGDLSVFKQWKYIELSEQDLPISRSDIIASLMNGYPARSGNTIRLPPEINDVIWNSVWIHHGQSVIDKLTQLIHELHLFSDDTPKYSEELDDILHLWWRVTFNTIELLYKYKFVDQKTVTSFFRSAGSLKQLFIHAKANIFHKEFSPNEWGLPLLTKNWRWHRMYGFVKALNRDQRAVIDGYFLLGFSHDYELRVRAYYPPLYPDLLKTSFKTFEPKEYLPLLSEMQDTQSNYLSNKRIKNIADEHALRIICFLEIRAGLDFNASIDIDIVKHFCYILEFIANHLSPEITQKVATGPRGDELRMMLLKTKLESIQWQSNDFSKYVERYPNWRRCAEWKSAYHDYLSGARGALNQLKSLSQSHKTDEPSEPPLARYESILKSLERNFASFE